MFDTALKHFIYDFCITLIFDKWKDSFGCNKVDGLKVGDYISRISHAWEDEHYFGCVVKNIITKTTLAGEPYFLAFIDYESSKGVAIDEWQDEVSEYLEENGIDIDDLEDDENIEYDITDENLKEYMNDEEVEFMEYPDMICINSLYYVFHQ
jgi:hypothetical protein